MSLEIIVLAAGQGTRMRSKLPKVLHDLAGRPLLAHVLRAVRSLEPQRIHVVIGHAGDQVRAAFADARDLTWVSKPSSSAPDTPSRRRCPVSPTTRRCWSRSATYRRRLRYVVDMRRGGAGRIECAVVTAEMPDPSGWAASSGTLTGA